MDLEKLDKIAEFEHFLLYLHPEQETALGRALIVPKDNDNLTALATANFLEVKGTYAMALSRTFNATGYDVELTQDRYHDFKPSYTTVPRVGTVAFRLGMDSVDDNTRGRILKRIQNHFPSTNH
jgi:hypothetical protein